MGCSPTLTDYIRKLFCVTARSGKVYKGVLGDDVEETIDLMDVLDVNEVLRIYVSPIGPSSITPQVPLEESEATAIACSYSELLRPAPKSYKEALIQTPPELSPQLPSQIPLPLPSEAEKHCERPRDLNYVHSPVKLNEDEKGESLDRLKIPMKMKVGFLSKIQKRKGKLTNATRKIW